MFVAGIFVDLISTFKKKEKNNGDQVRTQDLRGISIVLNFKVMLTSGTFNRLYCIGSTLWNLTMYLTPFRWKLKQWNWSLNWIFGGEETLIESQVGAGEFLFVSRLDLMINPMGVLGRERESFPITDFNGWEANHSCRLIRCGCMSDWVGLGLVGVDSSGATSHSFCFFFPIEDPKGGQRREQPSGRWAGGNLVVDVTGTLYLGWSPSIGAGARGMGFEVSVKSPPGSSHYNSSRSALFYIENFIAILL